MFSNHRKQSDSSYREVYIAEIKRAGHVLEYGLQVACSLNTEGLLSLWLSGIFFLTAENGW